MHPDGTTDIDGKDADGTDTDDPGRDPHPTLSEKEDRAQRGDDPPGSFGHAEQPDGDLRPGWQPSGAAAADAGKLIKELGRERRPRREDVYPYLLLRTHSPGDRGARPVWPPIPCWESPDVLLMDASDAGPFNPGLLVAQPVAGRRYRVFIRVWNLGLMPAIGVHVRAWFVNPGFFGGDPTNPAYQPVLIGGAMVNLDDRTRPDCVKVVELDRTWDIPQTLTGHECLLASASCPLDIWAGVLDANADRHVGQRNVTILAGQADMKLPLFLLGERVTRTGTLEVWDGGLAVAAVLAGIAGAGGKLAERFERAGRVTKVRHGVRIGDGTHLLTMFHADDGWLVADSARVWAVAMELGLVSRRRSRRQAHPLATPLGGRGLIEQMGPKHFDRIGLVLRTRSPGEALVEGIARSWDLPSLDAKAVARALGGNAPTARLLRFSHTEPSPRQGPKERTVPQRGRDPRLAFPAEGTLRPSADMRSGGYSIAVVG